MSGIKRFIGWAAVGMGLADLTSRVEVLEKDSHPPIDLTPLVDEILAARGYVATGPALTPSEALAKLLLESADALQGERRNMIQNYTSTPKDGEKRDIETIEERWVYDQVNLFGRLIEGLRAAAADLAPTP